MEGAAFCSAQASSRLAFLYKPGPLTWGMVPPTVDQAAYVNYQSTQHPTDMHTGKPGLGKSSFVTRFSGDSRLCQADRQS